MKETEEEIPEWKEVEKERQGYVAWEEDMIDKPVIGLLKGFETGTQGGQIAIFTDDKGEEFRCSASTVLYDKLKDEAGKLVKIVYLGLKRSGRSRPYKDFKVYVKLANARIEEQRPREGAQASPSSRDPMDDYIEAFV